MAESTTETTLGLLRGVFRGFDGVSRHEEAAEELTKWLGVALGSESSQVTVHLADATGALRPASPAESVERPKRLVLVTRTFRSGRESLMRIRAPQGWALLMIPLVSAGRSHGVVEIAAPEVRLREQWDTVAAVVTHGAMVMGNLQERADLHAEMRTLRGATEALVVAKTDHDVLEAAIDLFSVAHDGPFAAWLSVGKLWQELVGVRGVPLDVEGELERELGELPPLDEVSRAELALDFARITGVRQVEVVDCGYATIALGDVALRSLTEVRRFGSMVEAALGSIHAAEKAERREHELMLGLASTAHELRRPMQGTRAAIDEVIGTVGEGTTSGRLLQRSMEELTHASQVVEALLRWSVGQVPVRDDVDLSQVARESVAGFAAHDGGHRVFVDVPGGIEIVGDRTSLRVVLDNLISNAAANSPKDQPVLVRITARKDTVRVEVVDRGPGVPQELAETIFDPFVRNAGGYEGAGLGLFIARRIVEAHGGRIGVDSSAHGSTFSVRLPRGSAEHEAEAASRGQ